ncbi:MAG: UbiA prenyltransferase [Marinobacter excellens HL-55]|uniref:UbiA prenyltransferase n=1 Tax=Marinobacter excellens HL-55 TaxID=1305731 RepID=A0A0P8BPW9_9GAMM|nr:MAG: UbiA prenyltransferase [Marinobacter excellens HL-55]
MDDTTLAVPPLRQVRGLVKLVRPKQWAKNGFVLAPLVFAGEFLDPASASSAFLAFALFCVGSSATYIVNDLSDIEGDRRHPRKRYERPLASGQVKPGMAFGLLIALYAVLAASWFIVPSVVSVIGIYLVLNIAYTFVLKHQPVLDIFTIAIGFVLRVYAGAMALAVPVSGWMFVTTLCLALYLAAVKRRQELSQSGDQARKVLGSYSVALVDRYAEMSATGALVFYSMFVMSARPELVVTVPLVLFGLFRYWYVVETMDGGESPTDALFSDWQLLLTVVLWVAACGWALWPEAVLV